MLPDYLSDDAYPFLPDLVQALREDAPDPAKQARHLAPSA